MQCTRWRMYSPFHSDVWNGKRIVEMKLAMNLSSKRKLAPQACACAMINVCSMFGEPL